MTWMKLRDVSFSCAMNTAATHWKSAAPSMLTVAPMGRMKRLMCLDTPLFSSTHFIIRGRVAELRNNGRVSAQKRHLHADDGARFFCRVTAGILLPGARSEGRCQSCKYAPEEGVRVLPRYDEVDGGQHEKAVDGVTDDTAGDVFSQARK